MRKKISSTIFAIILLFRLMVPSVYADSKPLDNGQFVAKPLVILVDFQDYKYDQLLEKEDKVLYVNESYEPERYAEMLFGDDTYELNSKEYMTMNKYYLNESRGLFSVKGNVFGWYTAKNDAAYYGGNQTEAAKLVVEGIDALVNDTQANIDLSEYDIQDQFDKDNDGDYLEPDGLIDNIIIIHAGRGEEWWSGGYLGEDAIWPFQGQVSWYTEDESAHEVVDKYGNKLKAESFIIVEQDTPLGLVVHEYGHSLGLPDLYGSDEPVQNWTVMAGASYTGEVIGSMPAGFGAYCKEQLQEEYGGEWQRKHTIDFNDIGADGIDLTIGASSSEDPDVDAVRINLPEKVTVLAEPYSGNYMYYSDKGNDLENFMTTSLDLTVSESVYSSVYLEFKTNYDIEKDWDYASIQVREEGSDEWIPIEGNITTTTNPNDETPDDSTDRNPGFGITGYSEDWVDAKFDLSKFIGKKIDLKFYYWTDGNTAKPGMYIDDIRVMIDNDEILFDDAEGDSTFILGGFLKSDGIVKAEHYYLLEWRNHQGVDEGLKRTYYNGEKTPYDPGLLVWYVDRTWGDEERLDQDATSHPGSVSVGIVDAGQKPVIWEYYDGKFGGNDYPEYQMHDAAFSLRRGLEYVIKWNTVQTIDKDMSMQPVFDDSRDYSNPGKPACGINLENYGLKILITEENADRSTAKIHIMNANNTTQQPSKPEGITLKGFDVVDSKMIVEAEGNLGEKAYIRYVSGTGKDAEQADVELKLENGKYEGVINNDLLSNIESWDVSFIAIEDVDGNAKAFYNSKLHSGYGIDFSTLGIVDQDFDIELVDTPDHFILDGDANVTVEITNKLEESTEATLIIALFDNDNNRRMINYTSMTKSIAGSETERMSAAFAIPSSGNYTVEVFVWDNWENKKALSRSFEIPVQ